jgi:hypothetical protein
MSHSDPLAMPDDCHRWDEPLSLLAAGCLDSSLEPPLRRHLVACPRCAREWEDRSRLARSLAAAAPPGDGHAAAIERRWTDLITATAAGEHTTTPPPERRPRRRLAILGGVAAAASVAILWGATDVGRMPPPPPVPAVAPPAVPAVAETPAGGPPPSTAPILVAHELALARSDAAFDDVLRRHSASAPFMPSDRSFLEQRFAAEVIP